MSSHFTSKRRRVFGVGRQHLAHGFFGGSAAVSFVVIFLISIFLIYEAVRFFPAHRAELTLARKSGQEYVDYLIREAKWTQAVVGLARQAYSQERDFRFGGQVGLLESFEAFEEMIEEGADEEIENLARARREGSEKEVRRAGEAYRLRVEEIVEQSEREKIDLRGRLKGRDAVWVGLLRGVRAYDILSGERPVIVREAGEEVLRGMSELAEARRLMSEAPESLERLRDRFKKEAAGIRAEAGDADDFPFEQRIEVIVASHDDHVNAVRELRAGMTRGIEALPLTVSSPAVVELVEAIRSEKKLLDEKLAVSLEESDEWNWREEVAWLTSVSRFFFGTEWRVGSEWRQVFGLLPLLVGSVMISLIAMLVAVPFALGAAIYVNQLSTRREKALIKPAIEMIQAIPSVVLGFFGVVVLGDLLMDLSASPWLSWFPGFPMTERLNVLNAGLLLALMAIPTIFTLCEDALNHVPDSLSEASLALGASKISTVGRVVMPAALSGVFAAVLLGFGRVIGETMVVLLVAGNRVAMPDWSAGVGVVTQPSHTITGVIAHEMGQVTIGSLHYRALFLLGLVLFAISLFVHLVAQRFTKRFVQYG